MARAGVEGPYGAHFGWNDKELYVVGKGEASHNRGKVLGLLDAALIDKSDRPIDSPRIVKSEQTSARRFHHEVKLAQARDLDAELRGWLKAAYELSE